MKETSEPIPEVQDVPPAGRRGRKTLAEQTAGQDIAALEAEAAQDRRLAEVEQKYGDDLPFDQHRIEDEVKFYLGQSAQAYFEAGKRLIRLKEHVGHGAFMTSLERIGLEQSVANKTMFTVRKFIEARIVNSETIPNLSPTKLYEIALLDPEDIEDLGTGGTVAGKTLDDLEKMTVREIKEAFRKEREDRKAKDAAREDVIKAKNDKIDDLERQLRGTPDWSPRERAKFKLYDFQKNFVAGCQDIRAQIRVLRQLLADASTVPAVELDQIRQFAIALVDEGTEAVINDWEVMTQELEALAPSSEAGDVPALG
jgi:hypothetical protein